MSYVEKSIQVAGFNIAMKIWNANCSNPILCLHGKMDNAASFDFLAPLFPNRKIVAVDFPGTGYSSHYPEGVMPNWKNDAYLILHLLNVLGWDSFDIISHSLGSLGATLIGIAKPEQVTHIIYLDILGPTVNFIDQKMNYFHDDIETYLSFNPKKRTTFLDQESAINDRMICGNISYEAAQALVKRGTIEDENGWHWTFDKRLRCVASTLPCEDELKLMFSSLDRPVCLIRANQGVPYPQDIFKNRAQYFQNLTIYEVQGGHHVHMDNPIPVANLISKFLG